MNQETQIFEWTDEKGRELSIEVLLAKSSTWSVGQWNRYIDWYECLLLSPAPAVSSTFNTIKLDHLEEALNGLSPLQGQVLKLIFWSGKSHREIGRILGVTNQAVYGLKRRAIRNLAKRIRRGLSLPLYEGSVKVAPDWKSDD